MSHSPIKILQIINDIGMGGGEYYVLRLAHLLTNDQIEVICTCKRDQLFYKHLVAEGLKTLTIDLSKKVNPRTTLGMVLSVQTMGIDIIHAHGPRGALYGRLTSFLTRKPLVTTYHVPITKITDLPNLKKQIYAHIDRTMSVIDRKILAVSKAVKKELVEKIRFPASKVEVVYTGLDPKNYGRQTMTRARERLNLRVDGQYLGYVGRLSQEKGLHTLLKSFSLLTKDFPDLCLVIVGDGLFKGHLLKNARAYELMDKCRFLGYREDVPDILPAFNLLVLPSLTEGFPLILLEGMASGLPIVASNVGGIPEIVRNGNTGLLVPPNAPKKLAKTIKTILLDSEMSQQFGIAGEKIAAENFSAGKMRTQMEQIYQSLLESKLK